MIFEVKFFESVDGIPFGASRSQVRAHFGSFKSVPEIGTPGSPKMERDFFHPTAAVTYIDDGFAFFHTLDAELIVDGRNLNKVPYQTLLDEYKSKDPQLYCSAGFISFKYGFGVYDEGEDSFDGPLRLPKATSVLSKSYVDVYVRSLILLGELPSSFQVEKI